MRRFISWLLMIPVILLLFAVAPVFAAGDTGGAKAAESWLSDNMFQHATTSAVLGVGAIAAMPNRPATAFALVLAVGVAKELRDSKTPGNYFSRKALVWDAIGAGFGVSTGHLLITARSVAYTREF